MARDANDDRHHHEKAELPRIALVNKAIAYWTRVPASRMPAAGRLPAGGTPVARLPIRNGAVQEIEQLHVVRALTAGLAGAQGAAQPAEDLAIMLALRIV